MAKETLESTQQKILKETAKLEELRKEHRKLSSTITRVANQLQKLKALEFDILDSKEQIGWSELFSANLPSEKYREASSRLYAAHRLFLSGVLHETQQRTLQLTIDRNDSERVAQVENSFREILPLLKTARFEEVEEKCYYVDIMERTLSENSRVTLLISESLTTCYILRTRFSKTQVEHRFDTMTEALTHISKHEWYQDPDNSDED